MRLWAGVSATCRSPARANCWRTLRAVARCWTALCPSRLPRTQSASIPSTTAPTTARRPAVESMNPGPGVTVLTTVVTNSVVRHTSYFTRQATGVSDMSCHTSRLICDLTFFVLITKFTCRTLRVGQVMQKFTNSVCPAGDEVVFVVFFDVTKPTVSDVIHKHLFSPFQSTWGNVCWRRRVRC